MTLKDFKIPPKKYSPAAFWFLNGELEKEEMARQVELMADKGVYNFFLHARASLLTPYLEEKWWECISSAIEKAKDLGIYAWLYDEYAWPSGTAGNVFKYGMQKPSRVLAKGECNMAKGLCVEDLTNSLVNQENCIIESKQGNTFLSVFKVLFKEDNTLKSSINITDKIGEYVDIPLNEKCKILGFYKKVYTDMVDYLNKNTIKDFLNSTHEEYKKRFGEDFGKCIQGIFFDEIYNPGSPIVWTDTMELEFKARKGYNLLPYLPYIIEKISLEDKKYREDYHEVVASLYEEAFFEQVASWCEKSNLLLTGHTEENISYHPLKQGDYFRTMKHLHIPGSDCHDYRYRYPRIISPEEAKFSVSVARLYEKERCMSEALGGAGWNCSLQEFKRGINRLGALGISMFILHGFYYDVEGQGAQGDWPTSFFYQNPYWKYFNKFADYIGRISYMNTLGRTVTDVGIYYPIGELQGEFEQGNPTVLGNSIGNNFNDILSKLLENQIDADFIDADSLQTGSIVENKIKVGNELFSLLLFPQDIKINNDLVRKKIQKMEESGILILYYNEKNMNDIPLLISRKLQLDIELVNNEGDIHYNHRIIEGKHYYFIANGINLEREISIKFRESGIPRIISVETGDEMSIVNYCINEHGTTIQLHLYGDEAFYIILDKYSENKIQPIVIEDRTNSLLLDSWESIPINFEDTNLITNMPQCTELEIPIAQFYHEKNTKKQEIRICNTKKEQGSCGRHISNWKASWITRRPAWQCDCKKKDLYFRKIINIDEAIEDATICIAAVGSFEVFVNEKFITTGIGYENPIIINLKEHLNKNRNLLAIHVHNDTPTANYNVLEEATLPSDGLISLILEGSILTKTTKNLLISDSSFCVNDTKVARWNSLHCDFESISEELDVNIKCFWSFNEIGKWFKAWERGTPPLLPWGEIPLFNERIQYPLECTYEIIIPVGVTDIMNPIVMGNHSIYLDGEKVEAIDEKIHICNCNKKHTLTIKATACTKVDGLKEDIRVMFKPISIPLDDWKTMGLEWFSGRMIYTKQVLCNKLKNAKYELYLEDVHFCVEIWINQKLVDVKIWAPYIVDISNYLVNGNNLITLVVSNLAGNIRRYMLVDEGQALGWNRYWNRENIDRDKENLRSGILGNVYVKTT